MKTKLMNVLKSKMFAQFVLMSGLVMLYSTIFDQSVFADDPKIVTGTKELLTKAGAWVTGLIPATGILMLTYQSWMKQQANGEPSEMAKYGKAMKNTLIYSALGVTAAGLFTVIMAFYV